MNNKLLLLILAGLLVLFIVSRYISGGESTFNPVFAEIPSEQVDKIVLQSKADAGEKATLVKYETGWKVTIDDKTFETEQAAVDQVLEQLSDIQVSYIAAKDKDKWAEYELGPDEASRVTVYSGKDLLADFYVGKFSVNQQARQVTSYFRKEGKEEVYAVTGMAGMMLGQSAHTYRNKKLLDLNIEHVESLTYEGDLSYKVNKQGDTWIYNQSVQVDSARITDFLLNLRSMSGDGFAGAFGPEDAEAEPLKKLTIDGSNMKEPVVVRCWHNEAGDKRFVIESSQFPGAYFASDSTRIFKRIFKTVEEW